MFLNSFVRILSAKSQLWQMIIATAREHEQFGRDLVICCDNHPDTEILVASAEVLTMPDKAVGNKTTKTNTIKSIQNQNMKTTSSLFVGISY